MGISSSRDTASKKNPVIKKNISKDAVFGIYLAEIVSTKDISRTGRIRVFIPAISKDKNSPAGYFDAVWTSPFAGGTDPRTVGQDVQKPQDTMSSYGLWTTVPDNGNLVLIAFGDGNTKYPMVMSCLFPDRLNYMLPGNAGGKTYQAAGLNLPTLEKNKRTADINHNDTFRPIQNTLASAIVKQGLAHDPIRGAGSSSARRESPSEVFGLLTPGPRDPNNFNYRLGGHSITLDDNLNSRQIRIRSAQGNQLLLDDTSGMVYLINKEGNVWMEFASSGQVFMYAENDINMRTKRNFNLRADFDVNIEAGQNVNIKAAKDNDGGEYIGDGAAEAGGQINLQSQQDTNILANDNLFVTATTGELHINAAGSIKNTTGDSIQNSATSDIVNSADGKVTTKSGGVQVLEAGGNIVEKAPKVLMNSGGPGAEAAEAADTATPIPTDTFDDNPIEQPTYDDEGKENVTNGMRQGNTASISTIVTTMVTSEPFIGHGLPNPEKDDQASMVPDESISQGLGPSSNGVGGSGPADVNTPAGLQTGYAAPDGTPKYTSPANVQNNFAQAQSKKLETKNIAGLAGSLASSIPPIRQPMTTPSGSKKAGILGELTATQNKMKMLAFDNKGMPADLMNGSAKSITNTIATIKSGGPGTDVAGALASQGIQTIKDGPSTIYMKNGVKIVDMQNGIGPVGTQMHATSELAGTAEVVKGLCGTTQLSDNQLLSLSSFANHTGTNAFAKSKVLGAVKNGQGDKVPNLMMAHSTLKVGGVPTMQGDYYQRRQFEGELFQTPDSISPKTYAGLVPFGKQASDLKQARRSG